MTGKTEMKVINTDSSIHASTNFCAYIVLYGSLFVPTFSVNVVHFSKNEKLEWIKVRYGMLRLVSAKMTFELRSWVKRRLECR